MQRTEVLILGAGDTGIHIANELAEKGLETVLIALPHHRENYLRNLVNAVSSSPPILSTPPVPGRNVTTLAPSELPHFINNNTLSINGEQWRFSHAVLATGCGPRVPDPTIPNALLPIDIFQTTPLPPQLFVLGAGPIGVCTAIKLAKRGCEVTLMSKSPQILPHEDTTTVEFVMEQLHAAGVKLLHGTRAEETERLSILCTGLNPNIAGLNLPTASVYADPTSGRVKTDSLMRTSNPRIYAAGSVTGAPFNTRFEKFQADLVIANIPASYFLRQRCMPEPLPLSVPFFIPLARIGITEQQAAAHYLDTLAVTETFEGGFVKIIGRRKSGAVVGAHAAGPGAPELMMFFDLMFRAEATLRDIGEPHHYPDSVTANAAEVAVRRWLATAGR